MLQAVGMGRRPCLGPLQCKGVAAPGYGSDLTPVQVSVLALVVANYSSGVPLL
jgi:hypothetical protein